VNSLQVVEIDRRRHVQHREGLAFPLALGRLASPRRTRYVGPKRHKCKKCGSSLLGRSDNFADVVRAGTRATVRGYPNRYGI
jgi:hypothetical protein